MSEDDDIAESVQTHGWHCIAVEGTDDEPGFTYTIGLCATFGHPEIVIVGLSPRLAHQLSSALVDDLGKGIVCRPGQPRTDLLEGYAVDFRPVDRSHIETRLGYAMAFYRSNPSALTALQLFWPDKRGRFPFELECDPDVARVQPRLEIPLTKSEVRAFRQKYDPGS